ncbi:MAG: HEPN domain-containing protein [Magnetococcales bacterium]|nr:HEPN domain-containing protein [Magnetococcales bacterium]
MSDADQANTFLRMAEKDSRALVAMSDPNLFDVEIFGFHVQQAVEKGLKAWLCLGDTRFPKKHDLLELNALLGKSGIALPESFIPLLDFTDFATTFRYDAYSEFDEKIDQAKTTALVEQFLAHVRQQSEMAQGPQGNRT